jgi:ABC-2 type transport system permease protein
LIGQEIQELERTLTSWTLVAEAALQVYRVINEIAGVDTPMGSENVLTRIHQSINALDTLQENAEQAPVEQLAALEKELEEIEGRLQRFQEMDPDVMVNLFGAETRQIAGIRLSFSHFYSPAVIALLLQHLCVTFGGLSIVREEWMGTLELFMASPLSAAEVLLGKYLSYLVFSTLLTLVLGALVVYGLGVPMLGSWFHYVAVIIGLTFASLGVGFVISTFANQVSQAVQYAMIVLLASVFFSGFFQELKLFRSVIQVISRLIPATYGIRLLQNIMLRGKLSPWAWYYVLLGLGIALFFIAWLLLRRAMVSH